MRTNSPMPLLTMPTSPVVTTKFKSAVRMKTLRSSLAMALAAPLILLAACSKGGADQSAGPGSMPPPEVSIVTVQPKEQAQTYEYVGQTAGSRETEIRSRVSGILDNRLYEEGSHVNAGAVLFQIDPSLYQAQLASAEAAASLAEAKFNQSKREYTRLTPLAAEKAISQKEFDDAKSVLEIAEASLKQARAQANEARLNVGYTKVTAPISGVTGIASKANGSLVTASDNLLTTVVQTDPIYVNFSISEADFIKLNQDLANGKIHLAGKRASNGSLGFDVKAKMTDGSIFPVAGKLNFTSERVNPSNGGFDARAQIANPDGALRPGQFVRVILNGASRGNAISVPQRAVIDGPMGKMVFTVTPDNKLAPRPVELDGWSNGEWIVTKGLQSGDRVLVDGFIKAHNPGMTVTPVPFAANANTGAPTAKPEASAAAKPAASAQ